MQSSSKELSTLVADRVLKKCKQKLLLLKIKYLKIPLANVAHLVDEWSETQSNVKLDGFRSRLRASCVSSHTEVFRYNETVCLWKNIYIYIYMNKYKYVMRVCIYTFMYNICIRIMCLYIYIYIYIYIVIRRQTISFYHKSSV